MNLIPLHLAVTWMLIGLIWVIQILSYPQFLRVGETEFRAYHWAHCWRIGLMVSPLMLAEAITAGGIIYQGGVSTSGWVSLALMPVIWLSTALLQAPLHHRLMHGHDPAVIHRLILTNWVRTLAWTARGILISAMW